ncbi:putative signal-transduction protein containing cAMP-binding and CBS domains [Natronococcus occultus SP4]|uniref:Putative signal-transduction protein containing cAMP-binding and CBS domains n=2 Tax=Natronococcus occultus TaxID=29288 RepID=L0K279_9EURY|nr:putative signal-transduction protein containing cAMP-binding and CBS domains [Natronococcus occultus SP4]
MDTDNGTQVREVMSTPLETISKDATLTEAATTMRDNDIKALVVRTDPPSIVTSTDLVAAAAEGTDPTTADVESVMTESVETVPPELYLEEIAAMMTSLGITHLPVVDGDDYVGMISTTDVTAQLS